MFKNVLFINLGGIGDEIMFLPSIISLKKEFPNINVTLALEKRSASITDLTKLINNTIFVQKTRTGMLKLLMEIRKKDFDLVISSGSNKLIPLLLYLSGIKTRVGYDTGKFSQKLLTHAIPLNKNQYALKMYHSLVEPFTKTQTELPCFDIELKNKISNSILIHPGVSKKSVQAGMIKTISANNWAELINELAKSGKNILLTGGQDDKEVIETISTLVNKDKYTFIKTKSLKDLAELISSAEIFVCSDSAPLHIATGVGTKTFAFFGSTDYKKLIPNNNLITPLLNNSKCPLKPCLWEKRQTTCKSLDCLIFDIKSVANKILNS